MAAFQSIVFDLDGVLVDSEPVWRRAEVEVLGSLGAVGDDATTAATKGLCLDDYLKYWVAHNHRVARRPGEVRAALLDAVSARVAAGGAPAFRPAIEAARWAREAGLRVGVATSSPRMLARLMLEKASAAGLFEVLAAVDDGMAGKPDPAVYIEACSRLGVEPSASLAVEDSANGVRAAKAAGMVCIAVPALSDAEDPTFSLADQLLRDRESLPGVVRAWAGGAR